MRISNGKIISCSQTELCSQKLIFGVPRENLVRQLWLILWIKPLINFIFIYLISEKEQLQNTPVRSRWGGRASRIRVKFLWGSIIELGSFLCAGYRSTRGYASELKLRAAVFWVFSRGTLIIERGSLLCAGYSSTRGYASNQG